MYFKRKPYTAGRYTRNTVDIKGIGYSESAEEGSFSYCENLSSKSYPNISVRHGRAQVLGYENITALGAWEKLIAVKGTQLLYDGEVVGEVTEGEKQFAIVNTKVVIWPDKKYLDITTLKILPLGAMASASEAVFGENMVTFKGAEDLTKLFKSGDVITLSGCENLVGNNGEVRVDSVTATAIKTDAKRFVAGSETGVINIERRIPDLDYICESENRLWGCSNSDRTIYASALGDPTNFFTYQGLSTDSYAVAVGSEGDFTGCCRLSTSVLFWKEQTLHKILGSYPAEYTLNTYNVEGLKKGCHKSQQIINEILYYMTPHGVYGYQGGTPYSLSTAFGNKVYSDCVAGNDGIRYYLSAAEKGERHLFVYDTRWKIWLREDDTKCVDFARIGTKLYFLTKSGEVYIADSGENDEEIKWTARFNPFYETSQGRKRYSKVILQLELEEKSSAEVKVRCDDGLWKSAGRAVGGKKDAEVFRIAPNRCNKFELEISGKGACKILSVLREFAVSTDAR